MKIQEASPPASMTPVALLPTDPLHSRLLRTLLVIWRAMTVSRKVAVGSVIVGFFIVVGLIGPFFLTADPNTTSSLFLNAPSLSHLLGTTVVGQDIFSQLVAGTRTSVFWGLGTGLLVTLLSVVVGLVSGYFGGWIDDVLTLLTNVSLVLPALPLAIVLAAYFPRGPLTIALVIVFTNWAWQARVLRAQTLSMRNREFVTATRAVGEKTWRIIFLEILPNEIAIVAASFITTTIQVLLAVAALEFLGFGDNRAVSWGTMLYDAQTGSALFQAAWWWFAPPGLCIALLGAGLALLNFGIDEVADPRLRQLKRRVRRGKAATA